MLETVMQLNIFWDLWYFFQDSLINNKLKRTVFIQNSNFVLQYTLYYSKVWGQLIFSLIFLKEINTFIQQGCVKLIKSDSIYSK